MDETLLLVELPEWSALQVVGDPVTKEQAGEIILKTSHWEPYYGPLANREICQLLGFSDPINNSELNNLVRSRIGPGIGEFFLNNTQMSGSHQGRGWINWSGKVFCNYYDLGKDPLVGEIFSEWSFIAGSFPFLNLRCQLYPKEACKYRNQDLDPLIEFIVSNGKVTLVQPDAPLCQMGENPRYYTKNPCTFYNFNLDLLSFITSAIHRMLPVTEENLGKALRLAENPFHRLHILNLSNLEELEIYEDYAMAQGWISKPPKNKKCWAIRESYKNLRGIN